MKQAIVSRLKEPSTWAGLSAIGILFGVPPGTIDLVGQALIAITGAAAIALPEKKPAGERRGTRTDRRKSAHA